MLLPTLARRLRTRPVRFERWAGRAASATPDAVASWPVDAYTVRITPDEQRDGTEAAFVRLREAILTLRLFPSTEVTLAADTEDGRAADGATVVQRATLGPLGLETGVRLIAVETGDEAGSSGRVSVTWATLRGHPERGIETFSANRGPDGSIVVSIEARSQPATIVVRLGTPFARWLQRRYSRAVLRHLAAIARGDRIT